MTGSRTSGASSPAGQWSSTEPEWAGIVELSPVATMLVAGAPRGASDQGRILYANAVCRQLLGRSVEQPFTDESIFQIVGVEAHDELAGVLSETYVSSEISSLPGRVRPTVEANVITPPTNGDGSEAEQPGRPIALHLRPQMKGAFIVQIVDCNVSAALDELLFEQQRFRSALLELSELAHSTEDDAEFYQRLIERAVEVVPGAQAGSVQLNIPGSTLFRFEAAMGYDLARLQERELDQAQFFRDALDPTARVVRDFGSDFRSPELDEWLRTAGRLSELVVNVSAPVLANGSTVAFLSLDNFDDPAAMTETSVEMTTVLGRLIGELWLRRDLEAKVRSEREALRHQALHDPLTGVANRRSLEHSLTATRSTSRRRSYPQAVLFVDLDDFKAINDRYGHEVGDQLLMHVGAGLSEVVRSDDIVGRWGGDEFLILPHRVESRAEAMELGNRILRHFERDLELSDGRGLRVRLTLGVGYSEGGQIDKSTLVRAADEALYEAKAAGKGCARLRQVSV